MCFFFVVASCASSLRPHTHIAEGLMRFLCGGSRASAFPSCSKFFLFPLAQNKRMPQASLSAHKWQMVQAVLQVLQVLQALLQVLQVTRVLQRWHRDTSTLHTRLRRSKPYFYRGSRRYFRAGMMALNCPTRPAQAVLQVLQALLQGMRMVVWMRTEEERT